MSRFAATLATAAALALATACSNADRQNVSDTAGGAVSNDSADANARDAMSDSTIVASMIASNASEIALSTPARDSAASASVKAFARMMVTDHNAMNATVHAVANQLSIVSGAGQPTQNVREAGGEMAADLRGKRGAEFDRAYMDAMVKSHEDAMQLLNRASTATNTAQLDQTITDARTKVQAHLDRARQVRDSVKQ